MITTNTKKVYNSCCYKKEKEKILFVENVGVAFFLTTQTEKSVKVDIRFFFMFKSLLGKSLFYFKQHYFNNKNKGKCLWAAKKHLFTESRC